MNPLVLRIIQWAILIIFVQRAIMLTPVHAHGGSCFYQYLILSPEGLEAPQFEEALERLAGLGLASRDQRPWS
jgi:hypothetical protein